MYLIFRPINIHHETRAHLLAWAAPALTRRSRSRGVGALPPSAETPGPADTAVLDLSPAETCRSLQVGASNQARVEACKQQSATKYES